MLLEKSNLRSGLSTFTRCSTCSGNFFAYRLKKILISRSGSFSPNNMARAQTLFYILGHGPESDLDYFNNFILGLSIHFIINNVHS